LNFSRMLSIHLRKYRAGGGDLANPVASEVAHPSSGRPQP
jgi:hypothetical protein